jgi:predicted DNA-binding transcriptional regulator AlpA
MTMREGETVETQETEAQDRFVGYGPAAEYLGLKRNTLSSYVARGIGPEALPDKEAQGQYNLPVFTRAALDAWKESRPGQGARTDLVGSAI